MLTADWLDQPWQRNALSFLSDEAVCFYLPAFMTLKVTHGLEAEPSFHFWHGFDAVSRDTPIGGVGSGLRTWNARATARWSRLDERKAQAVILFLENWIGLAGEIGNARECREALAVYWRPRAGGDSPRR